MVMKNQTYSATITYTHKLCVRVCVCMFVWEGEEGATPKVLKFNIMFSRHVRVHDVYVCLERVSRPHLYTTRMYTPQKLYFSSY